MKWTTIEELFQDIEKSQCKYVVLRSFEEIFSNPNYIKEGHDIDILCAREDVKRLRSILGVYDDGVLKNIEVNINETEVCIDITCPGDGEFIEEWENEIIKSREVYKDGICHIPDMTNYFYVLLYHSFVHKGEIPDRYVWRLKSLSTRMGIGNVEEQGYKSILISFLKSKQYKIPMCLQLNTRKRIQMLLKKILEVLVSIEKRV